ncbi:hypothetical protein JW756_06165 [Candidatus Woesearchaeota archaeon]|nr:hypothetical protein [Candidatus Woesearchaeota archaeon]
MQEEKTEIYNISVPDLGLESYLLSTDKSFGNGTVREHDLTKRIKKTIYFQGLCYQGEHYIFETPDDDNFDIGFQGKVVLKEAWRIASINERGEATVERITNPAMLEKIANEEYKEIPGLLDKKIN